MKREDIRRVCIATSYAIHSDPRAPRYAAAIAKFLPNAEVLFVDCVPRGQTADEPIDFAGLPNVRRHTVRYPWRGSGVPELFIRKVQQKSARALFVATGHCFLHGFTTRSIDLAHYLHGIQAEFYGGFNIDALLPVWQTARKHHAPMFFDCQEYYSDMAHDQSETERAMIRHAEREYLKDCALVLAATPQIADRLGDVYGLSEILPLDNAAPLHRGDFPRTSNRFSLYWRNGVVDVGSRGLGEALRAVALLPPEIQLYIQGRTASDGGERVNSLIRELAIEDRVVILPPFLPDEAVEVASHHAVGLCPEQLIGENLMLTASNKLFDYLMAGLAVVASETAGLRDVIRRSEGGLLYPPGDPGAMADRIHRLYSDRSLLNRLRHNAREFALREGNLEAQVSKLCAAIERRVFSPNVVIPSA